MILVDTSVWVEHLQQGSSGLIEALTQGKVLTHEFVVGELALGSLKQRERVLSYLSELPHAATASHAEVLAFVAAHRLHGVGIGYVDVHLLASCLLAPGTRLWTLDKRLHLAALQMGLAYAEQH